MKTFFTGSPTSGITGKSGSSAFIRVLMLAVFLMGSAMQLKAAVAGLGFSQSNATYTEISSGGGATVIYSGADDDATYTITFGFNLTIDGTVYTSCTSSANGWISFGGGASSYSPLSGGGGSCAIAGMGSDMQGNSNGEESVQVIGTSPNRVLVFQWKNWNKYPYSSYSDNYNFQIRVSESGSYDIIWGSCSISSGGYTVQTGLRGASTADYNCRNLASSTSWSSTTVGTSAAASCYCSPGYAPSSGLDFHWALPALDAALYGFAAPTSPMSAGSQNVTAILKNSGSNTLTSCTINWSINGTAQTAVNWTGSLAFGQTANVTLGTYNFAANVLYTISATSSAPNGGTDQNTSNDTYSFSIKTALCGTFTIGSGGTYATFAAAMADLAASGNSCSLVYNVIPGTYNEQVTIPNCASSSPTRTITIQSQNGSASSVIIGSSSSAYSPGTVVFNGSKYTTLKNVTIIGYPSTAYAAVYMYNGASKDSLLGNTISSGSSSASGYAINHYAYSTSLASALPMVGNVIMNNTITGCYYGIYNNSNYGISDSLVILNNTIQNCYYYGIYNYPYYGQSRATIIKGNTVGSNGNTGNNPYMGLYNYTYFADVRNTQITNNTFYSNYDYGFYMPGGYNGNADSMKINNNSFNMVATAYTATAGYCYLYYPGYYNTQSPYTGSAQGMQIMGNTFSSASTSYVLYCYGWGYYGKAQGLNFSNNTITHTGASLSYLIYGYYMGYYGNLDNLIYSGNTFNSTVTHSYGFYNYYMGYSGSIRNATISNNTFNTPNCTYPWYWYNGGSGGDFTNLTFTGNAFTSVASGYPMYIYYGNYNNATFSNNTFTNGTYGLYLYSGTNSQNAQIKNNTFTNQTSYGLYAPNLDGSTVSGNTFTTNSASSTNYYGMYLSPAYNAMTITKNKVSGALGGYGLYLNCSAAATPAVVANNFFSIGSGANASYGVMLASCVNTNLYHNSINVLSTSSSSYGMYVSGGSGNNIQNNSIVNQGNAGYAMYVPSSGYITTENNNNLYAGTATNLAYYNGSNYTSLANWTAGTGFDAQGVSVNPAYVSNSDLHASSQYMNGRAAGGLGITDDIDGNTRSAAPDIGANEFSVSGLDGAIRWIAPARPVAGGLNNVIVQIVNTRSTPITTVHCSYTDGTNTYQQDFNFTPAIQTNGAQNITFTTQYNLTGLTTFSATLMTVNAVSDDEAGNNNTGNIVVRPALNGTYTICSSGGNFLDIPTAQTALQQGGVVGPVIFNLCAGTYNTQVNLVPFIGGSLTNTVTFQSATGNASGVTIVPLSTGPNYYTVQFAAGSAYYVLNNLTIGAPVGYTDYLIQYQSGANNDKVQNCIINAGIGNTSAYGIYANGASGLVNITIQNNQIIGGYMGIYFSASAGNEPINLQITGNAVKEFYYYGIYANYLMSSSISGNDISRPTATSVATFYGLYLQYLKNVVIEKNKIHAAFAPGSANSNTAYGIYYYNYNWLPPAGQENIIRNNLIYDFQCTGTIYGLYIYYADQGLFVDNNTIAFTDIATVNSGSTYGIYDYSYNSAVVSQRVEYKNNIIDINRQGYNYGWYFYEYHTGSTYAAANNNLYYIAGGYANQIGNYFYNGLVGYSGVTAMSQWQTMAAGFENNSVYGDPQFKNQSGLDYHILYTSPAARAGLVLSYVPTDLDGKVRSSNFGDIGSYVSPAVVSITGTTSPGVIGFGNVGNKVIKVSSVANSSAADPITVSGINVTGIGANSFKLYASGTQTLLSSLIPAIIPVNSSIASDVVFGIQGISQAGDQTATVTFTHSGANSPNSVTLTGHYSPLVAKDGSTDLLATGAKFDVGGALVNGTPVTKNFTLGPDVATLDVPMAVSSYTITGTDAAFFSVSTIPGTLSASIGVSVTLNPAGASAGSKTAQLNITHTGANGPITVIQLGGKVGKPVLGAPSELDLPFVFIGQTYSTSYDNVGYIPLTRAGLVDIDVWQNPVLTGSGVAQMEIVSNNGNYYFKGNAAQLSDPNMWSSPTFTTPLKITDVQPWNVVVRMKQPLSNTPIGSYNATILFSDGSGAPPSPCSANNYVQTSLVGSVISDPTKLQFFPLQLIFGTIPVNTSSQKTLIVRNQSGIAGNVNLLITGTDYTFLDGTKSKILSMPASNDPTPVVVVYAPATSGPSNGVITASGVINNSIALSGTGLAPQPTDILLLVNGTPIPTQPNALNFGSVVVGLVGQKIVTVQNNSASPVVINPIQRSGANATQFTVDASLPMTIPANGAVGTFNVNFIPTSSSSPLKTATITMFNSSGTPKIFNVSGTAVDQGGAVSVTLTPSFYEFGNVTGTYQFIITNNGITPVTLSGAVTLGSANFTVLDGVNTFPRTITGSGGTTTITVQFNSIGNPNGSRSGTLMAIVNGSMYLTSSLHGTVPMAHQNGNQTNTAAGDNTLGFVTLEGNSPNPFATSTLVNYRLNGSADHVTLRVYNVEGKEVGTFEQGAKTAGTYSATFSADGFSSGSYFYVVDADGVTVGNTMVIAK